MDNNRYVQLTETGLKRLHAARRRYAATVDEIVVDVSTPSVNTIKRVLRQEPVFVSTLDRIWDYFQRRATEKQERLPYLIEGEDYLFVESGAAAEKKKSGRTGKAVPELSERIEETTSKANGQKRGWISRHVPRPNRLFTGRREALNRLHTALQAGPAALIADPQALTGLGGIGKTQTAIAYIYEHWRDYDRVFWVSAETVDALNDGLASLAEELELLRAGPTTKKQALETMHNWFRNESDWLLVLDNADDVETLAPYFPRHHGGRLILTTRARNTVKWAAPIPLVKFGQEEGTLLLLRRAGLISVHQAVGEVSAAVVEAAKQLCDELDGLPLALDQAGAYLAETASTVPDYLTRYREYGLRLLDSTAEPEHASVTVTFTLALEQMAKRSLRGPEAVQRVRLCAFLMPDAIPESILAACRFDTEGTREDEEAGDIDDIIAAMCSYSLASRNLENRTVTVHRLVQTVTREALSPEERREWMVRAVQAVADGTPDFEFEDWPLCDLLLPQWRVCAEAIREEGIETDRAAYLLYQAGRYLRARAQYGEAETNLRLAVAIAEKVHGDPHRITADYLDDLACLNRVLDRREEAEHLHARSITMTEQAEGSEHSLVASRLHNLGVMYAQYEEYDRAQGVFERALEIYEKQSPTQPQLIATTLTQLAGCYRSQGLFDEAEPCCRRALETYERLLDPYHIDIATGCNNLGLLYLTMGRYDEADALYVRAMQINERTRGPEHPETGTVAWGLARVRWKQGRRPEADELFQRALRIYTKQFGPEHARSARIVASYAEFQQERVL